MSIKPFLFLGVIVLPIGIAIGEFRLITKAASAEDQARVKAEQRVKQRFARRFESRANASAGNQWAHGRSREDVIARDAARYEGVEVVASYKPMQKLEKRRRSYGDKIRRKGRTVSPSTIDRIRDHQVQALLDRAQDIESSAEPPPDPETMRKLAEGHAAAW